MKLQQENCLTESPVINQGEPIQDISAEFNPSLSSVNSQEDDRYRQLAVLWVFSFSKNIALDTKYLAASYLFKLSQTVFEITKQNYEKVALTVLLLACKLNQIYPPKITSMFAKCKTPMEKEEIFEIEGQILNIFDFNISFENTTYSRLSAILGTRYSNNLEKIQKLLRIVTPFNEIYQYGDQIVAFSVIFLIIPNIIKEMNLDNYPVVKGLAFKVYQLYKSQKAKHQKQNNNKKDKSV